MTYKTYNRQLLVALLILATVAGPTLGAVAAQEAAKPAELVVRQESYVDEAVSVQTQNGTPVYTARGEQLWLKPQNFDARSVVDFGVDRGAGAISYDDAFGAYEFSSQGEQASFTVFWVVLEETQVSGANNTTQVSRVRYEATIRIVELASVDHVRPGELEDMRAAANNWESFNDTLQDVRESDLLLWSLRQEPPDTETLIQGMINTYVTTRDPFRLLTGGLFAVVVTLTLTVGGLLFLAIREGLAAIYARKLRKRLNIYQATEAEEGEISDRILELDRSEREQIFANLDFQDLTSGDRLWSDHEAASYRSLGQTPRAAFERIITDIMPPELQIRERLQAMSQLGYVAAVRERDEDGEIVDAEIVRESEFIFDEDEKIPIDDPSEYLVDAVWNDQTMIDFDPVAADISIDAFETDPVTFTIDEALEALDLAVDRFEDEETAAKLLQDHLEWAAKSEYTDETGTPRGPLRVLNSFYETATWIRDINGPPSARILAEHIERALLEYDPGREAVEYAEDVREGAA